MLGSVPRTQQRAGRAEPCLVAGGGPLPVAVPLLRACVRRGELLGD